MTSAMLTDFLKSLALLRAFLLLGVFLRAKVKFLQKAFIPSSVIGGFLLLRPLQGTLQQLFPLLRRDMELIHGRGIPILLQSHTPPSKFP